MTDYTNKDLAYATPVFLIDPATGLASGLISGSASISTVDSAAYESSHVGKSSAGTFYGVWGHNSGPDQFIQIHNAASLPADTAVPKFTFLVKALSPFYFEPPSPVSFSTGIVVCNSTTGPTKTIGAANCWFNIGVV